MGNKPIKSQPNSQFAALSKLASLDPKKVKIVSKKITQIEITFENQKLKGIRWEEAGRDFVLERPTDEDSKSFPFYSIKKNASGEETRERIICRPSMASLHGVLFQELLVKMAETSDAYPENETKVVEVDINLASMPQTKEIRQIVEEIEESINEELGIGQLPPKSGNGPS